MREKPGRTRKLVLRALRSKGGSVSGCRAESLQRSLRIDVPLSDFTEAVEFLKNDRKVRVQDLGGKITITLAA